MRRKDKERHKGEYRKIYGRIRTKRNPLFVLRLGKTEDDIKAVQEDIVRENYFDSVINYKKVREVDKEVCDG